MPDGPPPHVRSLLARLRNHCRATGLDQPRAQRHLAMMAITQMLDGAVIKGGRNLEIRYGLRASRASTDLDITRSATLTTFLDDLDDALAAGWQGFTGTARDRGSIAVPVPQDRRPHQIDIVTHYRGASGVGTVRLEVVREELERSEAPDIVVSRDASELFLALGLHPPAAVPVLPLPLQIAQKLHACTSPDDPSTGRINERAHDLIDLQIMVRDLGDHGLDAVRHVAERLFPERGQHAWPPRASLREGWSTSYMAAKRDVPDADLAVDAEAAVAWLASLIERVAAD